MRLNQTSGGHGSKPKPPPGAAQPPTDGYGFLVVVFVRLCFVVLLVALCVESFFNESARVESAFFFVVSITMPVSIPGVGTLGAGVSADAVSVDSEPAAVSDFELLEEHAPIAMANGTAATIFHFPIIPTS